MDSLTLRGFAMSNARSRRAWIAALPFAIAASSVAVAQEIAPQYQPVVTKHEGTFNGRKVAYSATVRETVVPNAAGRPGARIVSIAYTADGADPATRPVIFMCNGGPISPAIYLHMLALGPKRIAVPQDLKADPATFQLVDNQHTVLDVADIVFFDPASTGWSRVLDGMIPGDYNQNGTVDAADFTVWRNHLGQNFTLTNENPAAATPGIVDAEDYAFWKSHFGDIAGGGAGANTLAAIPEPATLVLLMLAATGWSVPRGRAARIEPSIH
jgi:hypothetical protein